MNARAACLTVKPGSTSTRMLRQDLRAAAEAFVTWLRSNGVRVTVTSTFRSQDTQRALYENYQRGCSRYPAAPPGRSAHGEGRAFDLHLDPPVYSQAGAVWESIGGTWGGRFNDPIHFEVR